MFDKNGLVLPILPYIYRTYIIIQYNLCVVYLSAVRFYIKKKDIKLFQVVYTLSTVTACAMTLKMNNAHILLVAIAYENIFPIY